LPEESKNRVYKYYILILIAGLIISSVSLIYPFGRDQGIYAYAGKLILEGKIDYKYSYNLRPPAIHYTYALGELIFGNSMSGMRIFEMIWQLLTSLIIFSIILKLSGSGKAGVFGSIFYLFLYFRLDYWHTLQTESFMNFFIAGSVLILISNWKREFIPLLISGLFMGITLLFKSTILLFVVLLILSLVFLKRKDNGFKKSVIYIAGIAFVFVLCIAYYFYNDAFNYLWEIQFVQIPMYAKIGYLNETKEFILSNVFRMFTYSVYAPLIFFSVILIILKIKKKEFGFNAALLASWFIAALFSIIIQWKFFYYHFILLLPPLTIIIFSYCQYLLNLFIKVNKKIVFAFASIVIILYALFAGKSFFSKYSDLADIILKRNTLQEKYIKLGITQDSVYTINKIYEITDYIKQNTKVKDKIFVWGIEPIIYYLSGRDCVSRFIYNTPLYWRGNNLSYQNEFIKSLKETNPELILVAIRDPMDYITGFSATSEEMLNQSPEFKEIIFNNYFKENEIAEFIIYRLKNKYY
jgi:hypothetical protein